MISMTTIEIPDPMYQDIERLIAACPELGYESPEEYIRESVRTQMFTLELHEPTRG